MYFKNQMVSCIDYKDQQCYLGFARGSIGIFDERMRNKSLARTIKGHSQYVSSVSKSSKEYQLVSSGYDGLIKVWDTRTENSLFEIDCHSQQKIYSVVECTDFYLSGGEDGKLVKHVFN